jgi:multidrug efflux pump subunit AcrA (membrane-fusion protein)
MKQWLKLIAATIFTLTLTACSNEAKQSATHTLTVSTDASTNVLYYSGIIQPLKARVITSPVDGAVADIAFQYGETVKPNQLLFKISSAKFLSDYKAALLQYIKTKSDFNASQTQLKESEFLHKNELISDDDYKMKQSNFYASRLALVQAKDSLENLLQQLDIKNIDLYNLSIADIDKITQAMNLQLTADSLRIASPVAGVVLAATKGDDESKKTAKGDTIKQGDVLAMIGDLSGINVRVKVNELTVNQLHVGQKIKITGIAFPEEVLLGNVTRVDRQGEVTGGGLPMFTVEVSVPKLTAQQQQIIHVGMSAKVEIDINEHPQIRIPMNALTEKNGEAFVKVINEKSGKHEMVAVKTGKTTMDSVAILSGLKEGQQLVIPN